MNLPKNENALLSFMKRYLKEVNFCLRQMETGKLLKQNKKSTKITTN